MSRIKKTSDEIKNKLSLNDVNTPSPHSVKESGGIYSKEPKSIKVSVYLDEATHRKFLKMVTDSIETHGKANRSDIWIEAINLLYDQKFRDKK